MTDTATSSVRAAAAAITSVTLEVPDPAAASAFYGAAFGLGTRLRLRASQEPTTGFRGFTLSLVVSQPSTVDALVGTARDAGATTIKPVTKSLWGYGGVVRAPDGTIWKIATSAKKDTGPATRQIDDIVLLLGVALAKDAGVPPEGTGSHRIAITSDAGPFTDPDGLAWLAPAEPDTVGAGEGTPHG